MFIEPVFGKKFFGRENILATMNKRVSAIKGGYRQNLALAGPMLAGKSSILRHFLKGLNDPGILPVYIELIEEGFQIFCIRFMSTILYQYLKSNGGKPENDFESLRRDSREEIPATNKQIDCICALLDKGKDTEAYEELLDLTSILKYETGKNCVVILDEFHNLSNFNLKKPFQIFGKFIMVQKNTMYIVSSSQKTLLKEILSKKLSLLFGNFEMLEVEGFDRQTARAFISDKVQGISVPENIIGYILEISKGNPFYMETILKNFMHEVKNIGAGNDFKRPLFKALANVLYSSDGILNQYFMNNINFFLEKKSRKTFIPILISMSRGNSKIKTINSRLAKPCRDLGDRLNTLQSMDLVDNSGIFYKIQDNLFEYWLKHVYSLKIDSIIDDMDIKYHEFMKTVDIDFHDFNRFISRDISDVIVELFSSFRNEKVSINMYERQMPWFDTVKTRKLSGNIIEIIGCKGKKIWVCHLKKEDITEEHDIVDLCNEDLRDEGMKIVRRAIVPLQDIDHNAFLLAKESGVWVWDVKQVNKLLRLYGKYEIVL